jgi:hypothetical protein
MTLISLIPIPMYVSLVRLRTTHGGAFSTSLSFPVLRIYCHLSLERDTQVILCIAQAQLDNINIGDCFGAGIELIRQPGGLPLRDLR